MSRRVFCCLKFYMKFYSINPPTMISYKSIMKTNKSPIWNVNTEEEYHEEKKAN